MKIGQLVRRFIPEIIKYCEKVDLLEIQRLQDKDYCKKTFNMNHPFWTSENVGTENYWKFIYKVNNIDMKVCNDWYSWNRESFRKYLINKKISTAETLDKTDMDDEKAHDNKLDQKVRSKGRYRGNAIGNAQNLLVRNILSNLGDEVFSESDWNKTKDFFDNCCAYCGSSEKLVIEHAVPINKSMLGEHRLGNIVPSCNDCNKKKGSQSYDQFLKDEIKLKKIEDYMKSKNYESLNSHPKSEIIAELLEKAYLDTAEVSKRYIQIIELIQNNEK